MTKEKLKHSRLNILAREIVEKNQYLTIATVDKEGNPWISPVCYANDRSGKLYFASIPSSRHSQNIKLNRKAAVTIFDSRQNWGEGVGLQFEAEISECSLRETLKAGKTYLSRIYPYPNSDPKVVLGFLENFLIKKKLYKFYKIIPKTVWINDPYSETDKRVEVKL
jgi:uncharacterized protein YhbP (UPF0306 family)